VSPGPSLPAAGKAEDLLLRGPAGKIQALVAVPAQSAAPSGFTVVCHPHPLHGGALTNKVAYTLASSALQHGLAAVRFNFRGVGKSEGAHDDGRGEADDTLAVAEWISRQMPGAKLVLAGFSFGAFVALKAAARAKPALLITIAPPFKYFSEEPRPPRPPRPAAPWLVVHSTDDEVVPYADTQAVLDDYQPGPERVTLTGAGHFFHGKLGQLQAAVSDFIGREWPKLR
jgi:alpha/beta superfamily hydrolase